jgi:hypothetical protein
MAGSKRPSFLKRQKEQKRLARAAEKRESKRLKKQARAAGHQGGENDNILDDDQALEPIELDDAGAEEPDADAETETETQH